MELLEGMFRNPIAMWVFVGIVAFFAVFTMILFLNEIGIIDDISDRIHNLKKKLSQKKTSHDIFNISPLNIILGLPFLIISFIVDSIKKWWKKHKWNVIIFLVNVAFLSPLVLMIAGVIYKLPEWYGVIFVFYVLFMLAAAVARADNKRSGNEYHYNWNDQYNHSPNHKSTYTAPKTVYRPKPRGLTTAQAKEKKEKIREKLKENKILQEKYEL